MRRDHILSVASSLFAEKGFAAATISDIAKRCGMSKALLYHYYDSKEELLFASISYRMRSIVRTALDVETSALGHGEKLEKLAGEIVELYFPAPTYQPVLVSEIGNMPEHRREALAQDRRELLDVVQRIFAALRPELADDPSDSLLLAQLFLGMLACKPSAFDPAAETSPAQLARLVSRVFLQGIGPARGVGPPATWLHSA